MAVGPADRGRRRHEQQLVPCGGERTALGFHQRLHDPRDFERVYAARKAVHAPHVVLFFCPNGLSIARLGVSVGAKHGNAVRRNRIKRVFRAAFRQCRHLLPPGHDYVLVPKKGVAEYSSAMVRAAIERIARNPRSGLPRPAGGGPEHSGHGNDAVAPAAERR